MWNYKLIYSHPSLIIVSRIRTGPVAEIITNGCPEKSENNRVQIAPAKIHSLVAYFF